MTAQLRAKRHFSRRRFSAQPHFAVFAGLKARKFRELPDARFLQADNPFLCFEHRESMTRYLRPNNGHQSNCAKPRKWRFDGRGFWPGELPGWFCDPWRIGI